MPMLNQHVELDTPLGATVAFGGATLFMTVIWLLSLWVVGNPEPIRAAALSCGPRRMDTG